MSVTVVKEPGVQVNVPIGGGYGTGVATELQLAFTDSSGKPLRGTATESNVEAESGKVSENPNPVPLSKKGTTTDWVGYFFISPQKAHLTAGGAEAEPQDKCGCRTLRFSGCGF